MDRASQRQRMIHHMNEIARHLHSIQGDVTAILDANLEIHLLHDLEKITYTVLTEDAKVAQERVLRDIAALWII